MNRRRRICAHSWGGSRAMIRWQLCPAHGVGCFVCVCVLCGCFVARVWPTLKCRAPTPWWYFVSILRQESATIMPPGAPPTQNHTQGVCQRSSRLVVTTRHLVFLLSCLVMPHHWVKPPCASHLTRFVQLVVALLRCVLSLLPLTHLIVTCHCVARCCHIASRHHILSCIFFVIGSGLVGCRVPCPQPLAARRHVDVDALVAVRFISGWVHSRAGAGHNPILLHSVDFWVTYANMTPSLNSTATASSQYLIVVWHYFTLKVVLLRVVFADMVPTCRKADIWVCRVGTFGNMFLHHVSNMSIDMSPTCRPRTFHVCLLGALADMPTSDICQLRGSQPVICHHAAFTVIRVGR